MSLVVRDMMFGHSEHVPGRLATCVRGYPLHRPVGQGPVPSRTGTGIVRDMIFGHSVHVLGRLATGVRGYPPHRPVGQGPVPSLKLDMPSLIVN